MRTSTKIALALGAILIVLFAAKRARGENPNQVRCEAWCAEHEDCVSCTTISIRPCDGLRTRLKTFRGPGKNAHACAEDPLVMVKWVDCQKWCAAHSETCKHCRTGSCGTGYSPVKTFRGKGKNVRACVKNTYGQASSNNRKDCERWCAATAACAKCSVSSGCGRGYKRIKRFGGRGKNWYGCKKR